MRTLSTAHISEVAKEIDSMESQEAATYRTYFFLSLLALVVAMGEDLPVWKHNASVAPSSADARSFPVGTFDRHCQFSTVFHRWSRPIR